MESALISQFKPLYCLSNYKPGCIKGALNSAVKSVKGENYTIVAAFSREERAHSRPHQMCAIKMKV